MQCRLINHSSLDLSDSLVNESFYGETIQTQFQDLELTDAPSLDFRTQFEGYMEMYSDSQTVADYLNVHQGWFCRCAQPMQVEPLGDHGYILTVGKFGSFGYELEPKMAVVLHPPQDRIYLMQSLPLAECKNQGYEVDYLAKMELLEIPSDKEVYHQQGFSGQIPSVVTRIQWELNLNVSVKFPKFIYKLPLSMIQKTGNRLLGQIVRQVSPRLTHKVQQDFHNRFNLPLPPKTSRYLQIKY